MNTIKQAFLLTAYQHKQTAMTFAENECQRIAQRNLILIDLINWNRLYNYFDGTWNSYAFHFGWNDWIAFRGVHSKFRYSIDTRMGVKSNFETNSLHPQIIIPSHQVCRRQREKKMWSHSHVMCAPQFENWIAPQPTASAVNLTFPFAFWKTMPPTSRLNS